MLELLPNNIVLAERQAALAPSKPTRREIGGNRALATWVSSFVTYVCRYCHSGSPTEGERPAGLSFVSLPVRPASCSWLAYDAVFRWNRETPWNKLDAALHQVYIANTTGSIADLCKHCHEIDHQALECAAASILPRCQQTSS